MAAFVTRSLISPLPGQISFKPSRPDQSTAVLVSVRRRSFLSVRSSIRGDTNNFYEGKNDTQALELKVEDAAAAAACDALTTDSLPRPLTSARVADSASGGSRLRVAYQVSCMQGVSGAYSESAAQKAYPNCEAVPCDQFETAFEAVEGWTVDRAVLPIENSLGGSIHRNYDLLLRHRLHIVGEIKYAVRHCLLANQGVKIEDLKRVLSHPQALAQCEYTLTRLGLVREAVDDTAGAAKYVALSKLEDTGAVASSAAAAIYGLDILEEDIQDDSDNVTRFLMLAREPIIPGTDRPFKTSIVFSLEEGPGILFKALAVFALRQINLTKIESRPWKRKSPRENGNGLQTCFHYLFYVDFEASMASDNAQNALKHLNEFATFLRVLGSYPADNSMI
ncbi:Arogenate dehydratase 2 [Linum grandiflorum]